MRYRPLTQPRSTTRGASARPNAAPQSNHPARGIDTRPWVRRSVGTGSPGKGTPSSSSIGLRLHSRAHGHVAIERVRAEEAHAHVRAEADRHRVAERHALVGVDPRAVAPRPVARPGTGNDP